MIDIGECFADSPPFRQRVYNGDRSLGQLEVALKLLCKSLRQSIEATQGLAQANMGVAEAVAEVGKAERMLAAAAVGSGKTRHLRSSTAADDGGVFKFADALQQMAQEQMVVELNRKQLSFELERDVYHGLEAFWKGDLGSLKELKRRWEKSCVEYLHFNSKYMSKKAKDPGLFEAAQEVADARKEYHVASLDYSMKLNEVAQKCNVNVFGALSKFLEMSRKFVSKQQEAIGELGNASCVLSESANESVDGLRELMDAMEEKRDWILINSEPLYNPLVVDRSVTPAVSPLIVDSKQMQQMQLDDDIPTDRRQLIREGYLYKKSSHAMRPVWARRYFILYTDQLEYYSQQEGNLPVPIDIRLCAVKTSSDSDRRFCFDLVSPIKTFTLQAENEDDMEHWMDCLTEAIQQAIKFPGDTVGSSTRSGTIDSILEEHRTERPMSKEEVSYISNLEGNKTCAECGDPDPNWASYNHGILLCIACSGVHRGLGAQISKVRSLDLDYWEPVQIDLMKQLGNANVNSILENSYPGSQECKYYRKPSPDSDQEIREQWTTAKYELGKFLRGMDLEDANNALWRGLESGSVINTYDALRNGANPDLERNGTYPLIHALQNGHYSIALLLLYSNADVNIASVHHAATPLHVLAGKDDSTNTRSMLLLLLKRRARVKDVADADGKTAIDVAVASGNAAAATVLRVASMAEDLEEAGTTADAESPQRHSKKAVHKKIIKKLSHHINK